MHKYLCTASIFSIGQSRMLSGGGGSRRNKPLRGDVDALVWEAMGAVLPPGGATLGGCREPGGVDAVTAGVGVAASGATTDGGVVDNTTVP